MFGKWGLLVHLSVLESCDCYAVGERHKQYVKCKMLSPSLCTENSNPVNCKYWPSP